MCKPYIPSPGTKQAFNKCHILYFPTRGAKLEKSQRIQLQELSYDTRKASLKRSQASLLKLIPNFFKLLRGNAQFDSDM